MDNESECIGHGPCEKCGSRDNLGLYDDGHTHCFGCGWHTPPTGGTVPSGYTRSSQVDTTELLEVTPCDLIKRCLSEEICRKFGYGIAVDKNGKTVQVAQYRDEHGQVVAQKVRTAGKKFSILGDAKAMRLFGQHLWKAGGRRVVVTEGEIDALSVAAATGATWPVVSLPNGAQSARKAIAGQLEWLESFELVVLAFDMDDPGRGAAAECVELFSPGKCAVAELPRKDANEMLVAGEVRELSTLLWQARTFRPDGIVSLEDIEARVLCDPPKGHPWFIPGLTTMTFGRRTGELIGIGAGTGVGKTDLITQQIAYDVFELGLTVGTLFLEQSVGETGRRVAGKVAGKRLHVPDGSWVQEELVAAWGKLKASGKLHLYDSFGAMDWETIKAKVRYMVTALGCQIIYLDHLTALAAAEDDERKALEKILAECASLAQELDFVFVFISHLATPEGKPHEEGGRVTIKNFKGSRAIGFWSHVLIGLERDSQKPEDPTTLRVLKERFSGNSTGWTTGLSYDRATGLLHECELTTGDMGEEFRDETAF